MSDDIAICRLRSADTYVLVMGGEHARHMLAVLEWNCRRTKRVGQYPALEILEATREWFDGEFVKMLAKP